MINSAYGNTMERLRKRISVRVVNNEKGYLKHTSKPIYITQRIFDKNYAAIHEIKLVLALNKLIYVGFTVLELLNGWCMISITTLLKKIVDAKLLFTDTGSLTYEIKSEGVYECFYKDKHLFALSNYPKDKFFDPVNKKLIGKMKDVHKGKPIDECIGLNSKIHRIRSNDGAESNTAKGVNIALEVNEYKDILFNKKVIRHKMRKIQSKKHKIRTYKVNKILLSCFDDKRYILDDGVHTLAYFHKDCKKQEYVLKDSYRRSWIRKDSHRWS